MTEVEEGAVDTAPAPAASGRIAELASQLDLLSMTLEGSRAAEKRAQEQYDRVEAQLFDALEAAGLRAVKVGTTSFRLNDLAWAKVTDPAAALAWAQATSPELVSINRQRLSVIVRQWLKGEAELPPGVDYSTSRKISIRR